MQIVGNILPDLERFFEENKHDPVKSEFTQLEDLLLSLVPNYSVLYRSSFFNKAWTCLHWHYDGNDHGEVMKYDYSICNPTHFITAAYPSPTQIIPDINMRGLLQSCVDSRNDEIINRLNKDIVTPNPGDVCLLNIDEIHRTNPADHNKPHLVIRCYLRSMT